MQEVEQELPDLRAAFSWAASGERGELLDSLALGLGAYYSLAGRFEAGAGLLEGAAPAAPGCSWKEPVCAPGGASRRRPGASCRERAPAARRGADRRLALAVLSTAGDVLIENGHAGAGRHELEQALALAGKSGLHEEQTAIRLALGQALAPPGSRPWPGPRASACAGGPGAGGPGWPNAGRTSCWQGWPWPRGTTVGRRGPSKKPCTSPAR